MYSARTVIYEIDEGVVGEIAVFPICRGILSFGLYTVGVCVNARGIAPVSLRREEVDQALLGTSQLSFQKEFMIFIHSKQIHVQ